MDPQPELTLIITQSFDGQKTLYQYHHSHTGMTSVFAANEEGIVEEANRVQKCAPYQSVPSFVLHPEGAPDKANYNFINAAGDYQSDYLGNIFTICVRSP